MRAGLTVDPESVRQRLNSERFSLSQKLRLALEILRSYVRMRLRLTHKDLPSILRDVRQQLPSPVVEHSLDEVLTAIRLGRAAARALAPLPFDSRCLVRSLVLSDLLARRGVASRMIIGVKTGAEFEAHAWIEVSGAQVVAGEAAEYDRLVEL
jgi:hypothetical protein